ncbi:SdrD B-like domain-containing protein, partial [Paracoccaceae bacterium GXU_MW_L88]
FDGLAAGDYQVRFTTPDGYEFTEASTVAADAVNSDSDANVASGLTGTVTLDIGEAERDVDAGLVQIDTGDASLGDTVWFDDNGNGVQDANEAGVAGQTVRLVQNGTTVKTTTTDANGKYLFTGLAAGSYVVDFDLDDGFEFTSANAGSNDAVDSDANETTGQTGSYTLAIGEQNLTVDAGVIRTATEANDDEAGVCADETKAIDVLENDAEGTSVTAINGQTISAGQSVTLASGASVTLNADGTLTFDGIAAYADLVIGEKATDSFTYEVTAANGATDTALVTMDICGATNTIETICASLPDESVKYGLNATYDGEDFASLAMTIDAGDNLLTGEGYLAVCIDPEGDLFTVEDSPRPEDALVYCVDE